MNTQEYRTSDRNGKTGLCIFIAVLYLACSFWIDHYGAFWSEDAGVKYLQVVNLIRSHWTDNSLRYPGEAFDPGFEFNPLFGTATYIKNGKIYTAYPLPFAFFSSLSYMVFGFPGLYLLPLLSTVGLLVIVRHLSSLLLDRRGASAATMIAAFSSPLFFYAFTFWELNVAGCIMCAGLIFFLNAERESRPGRIVLGGIIMGMAIFFREESILFLLALIIVRFAINGNRRVGALLILSSVIPLAGFLLLDYLSSGLTLAHLFHNIETRPREFGSLGAFLGYKWNLVWELIFSAHPNPWVSVVLATPAILFMVTWAVRWRGKRGLREFGRGAEPDTGSEFILLTLLSLVLVNHLCYLLMLYTSKFPIRMSMVTNGLLIFSPWVVFGVCTPHKKVGVHADYFWISLIFIALLCLAVPTSGGLQWGPRYLVVIYPLLVIISLTSFFSWRRIATYKRWLTFLFSALVVLGAVNEFFGLMLLKSKKDFNARAMAYLRASPMETVISIPWWIPLSMAPVFYEKEFFLTQSPQALERLIERLREKRRKGFVLIAENDPSIPDLVAARCHLVPDKIEPVRLSGDEYFQINMLEYSLAQPAR
ncbi:MAG: hypothetical protein NTZ78_09525 [Candidatus Aureabacteria bacterium]|nr:hypothetical protein [Candidatus Auribacterota bacterium]